MRFLSIKRLFVYGIIFLPLALITRRLLLSPKHDAPTLDNDLTPAQKRQLQEVADGMLAIYETLARMRFIDPEDIVRGPHDLSEQQKLYEELGMDPTLVYLYSILPYVEFAESFFQGASFADFRDPGYLDDSRDPVYASPEGDFEGENGQYMRLWYTPLTRLGNHDSVIIYDARNHRMWILDQLGGSTDHALQGDAYREKPLKNRNSLERYPSRPAGEVLRDIREWFRTMQELPRGDNVDGEWMEWDDVKQALSKNGWPDHFIGDQFEVDLARLYARSRARWFADEPLRKIAESEYVTPNWPMERSRMSRKIAEAKDVDEEWKYRHELYKMDRVQAWHRQMLQDSKDEAARRCQSDSCIRDGDMPLWEFEILRHELKGPETNIKYTKEAMAVSEDAETIRRLQHNIRKSARKGVVLAKAYEASKADAERLCPGRTFQEASGLETLGQLPAATQIQDRKDRMSGVRKQIDDLRQWSQKLPKKAVTARQLVADENQKLKEHIVNEEQSLKDFELWVAEHGDEDE